MVRLLFSVVGGEGHLQPLLPLARVAAAAGHVVAVTGAPMLGPVVAASGLTFIPTGPDVAPRRVPLQPIDLEREDWVVRAHALRGPGQHDRLVAGASGYEDDMWASLAVPLLILLIAMVMDRFEVRVLHRPAAPGRFTKTPRAEVDVRAPRAQGVLHKAS